MKYGKRGKPYKANVTSKFHKSKKNSYHCDLCNKSGHTADYCYTNSSSKKYQGKTDEAKPQVQLHTSVIANKTLNEFYDNVVVDSRATEQTLGNLNISKQLITMKLVSHRCAVSQGAKSTQFQRIQDIHSSLGHLSYEKIKHLKIHTALLPV